MAELDPTDHLLHQLRRWAADQDVAELARSRSQKRWLRQQAAESATFVGTLLNLAERREVVTIEAGGWAHSGRLVAVSTGLCVLDDIDDVEFHLALVALPSITMIQPTVDALGDREPDLRLDLGSALAAFAGDQPSLCLETRGGKKVSGVLEHVGVDVVGVRVAGEGKRGAVAHIVINAVSVCLL